MTHHQGHGHARVSWTALAVLVALAGLAGCSGSDSSSPPPAPPPAPTPTPPPPPPAGHYSVAGHRPEDGRFALNIFDPQTVASPALTLDFGSTSPSFTFTTAQTFDHTAHTRTWQGTPWLVYVRNGELFQVPLARATLPVPVKVTSRTDVCSVDSLTELDASGKDAIALIRTAGDDLSCATTADNRHALVRVGDAPAAAATVLPAETLGMGTSITDADGRLLWILALEQIVPVPSLGPGLRTVAYTPTLDRTVVGGPPGRSSVSVPLIGPLASGLWASSYDQVDSFSSSFKLFRVTGDATTLHFGPNVGEIGVPSGTASSVLVDQGQAYHIGASFDTLMRASPDGHLQPVGALDTTLGPVISLAQNASQVLLRQRGTGSSLTFSVIAKADGARRQLLQIGSIDDAEILLFTDTQLLYRTNPFGTTGDIRRVDPTTGADTLVEAGVAHSAVFSNTLLSSGRASTTSGPGQLGAVGLLVCRPATAGGDCRGGELVQIDGRTGTTTVLGRFPASTFAGSLTMTGSATEGHYGNITLWAIATGGATRITDTYSVKAGEAGSLRRITQVIP